MKKGTLLLSPFAMERTLKGQAARPGEPVKTAKDRNEERWVNIGVIGTPGAGKTSLINRLTTEEHVAPKPGAIPPTKLAGPLGVAQTGANAGKPINLGIFDTPTDAPVTDTWFSNESATNLFQMDVILVVFHTFEIRESTGQKLDDWPVVKLLKRIHSTKGLESKPLFLVANQAEGLHQVERDKTRTKEEELAVAEHVQCLKAIQTMKIDGKFLQLDGVVHCSAMTGTQVAEVFWHARNAAVHPVKPLCSPQVKTPPSPSSGG